MYPAMSNSPLQMTGPPLRFRKNAKGSWSVVLPLSGQTLDGNSRRNRVSETRRPDMALMNCPECGGQVSDKATACPHCGAPITTTSLAPDSKTPPPQVVKVERTGAAWEGTGFVLIVLGMFIGIGGAGGTKTLGWLLALVGFIVFIIGRFK